MIMRKIFFSLIAVCFLMITNHVSAEQILKSTIEDQMSVEVTVYNSNLGLVKDRRKIKLPVKEGELRFMDVAAYIMPETVHVKSINAPTQLSILEQNYEYDLMNTSKLLDKFVGKKIKLLTRNHYQDKTEIIDAELLSNNGGPIYRIGDEIFLSHPGEQILPEIPENLIAQPTLTWTFANQSKTPHIVEVSYLTNNISWKADYVVILNQDDTKADLSGWVTLDNKSGAQYTKAKLKLVAGEVNRASAPVNRSGRMVMMAIAEDRGGAFQEKAFFEYHIYDLQKLTTIKNNQTKQISLLEANGVQVKKEFLIAGNFGYLHYSQYRANDYKIPVNVYVEMVNSKENNMGMAIPAGIIRVYKEDNEKSLQFVGEDRVDHTPKDEKIKVKLGKAFDIVAERRQTAYRSIAKGLHESTWEVVIRNHKEEDVIVGVLEELQEDWEMLSKSHDFEKIDAFTLKFNVPVPKDKEVKLTFRIRVRSHY